MHYNHNFTLNFCLSRQMHNYVTMSEFVFFFTLQFCTGELTVNVVSGDHESFIQNESGLEVAKLINAITSKTKEE